MIGILPAAGSATRIHGLPKYLLPVPGKLSFLLERHVEILNDACQGVCIGCNDDSYDLVERYAPEWVGFCLAKQHNTMTETVLSVRDFISNPNSNIVFAMPDTFIEDDEFVWKLFDRIEKGADVAIAVFRARPGQHTHGGMVSFSHNRVTEVIDKPAETNLQYIWGALAWKPAFWDCLTPDMPHVGYGLPVAIERGLDVRAVICEGGFWDCGTSDEYFEMIRTLTGERVGA